MKGVGQLLFASKAWSSLKPYWPCYQPRDYFPRSNDAKLISDRQDWGGKSQMSRGPVEPKQGRRILPQNCCNSFLSIAHTQTILSFRPDSVQDCGFIGNMTGKAFGKRWNSEREMEGEGTHTWVGGPLAFRPLPPLRKGVESREAWVDTPGTSGSRPFQPFSLSQGASHWWLPAQAASAHNICQQPPTQDKDDPK